MALIEEFGSNWSRMSEEVLPTAPQKGGCPPYNLRKMAVDDVPVHRANLQLLPEGIGFGS